ncbi:nitrogen regulation protein NR(II) [Marinicellulosiphila megalodicopiae]|uniref:nitrogen regulation protein NR(II) n=1 Tax=Marinicellulosiphila megalodicopiae TaxID=2724896 RepID=UPI003BB0D8AA
MTLAYIDSIFDNLTTSVVLLDSSFKVTYVNASAEALFHRSSHQLIGGEFQDFFSQVDKIQRLVEAAGLSEAPVIEHDAKWCIKGHKPVRVDVVASPIVENGVVCVLLEIQNIERMVRFDREEQMRQKQETTQVLVRGVAHEIKNPLGGIRGAAQLLASEFENSELTEYTNIIIEEADRLRNLVDRMLGSREAGLFERVNIHQVVDRVYQLAQVECGKSVVLLCDFDPSIPKIIADKEQLIQAVLNVVQNAVQALKESGTPNAQITFKTRIVRQILMGKKNVRLACRLEIIDNGPGIPEQLKSDIFYPMISGRAKGTGLGLSIAQQIMHRHDGLIEHDSMAGRTSFSLYFPIEQK